MIDTVSDFCLLALAVSCVMLMEKLEINLTQAEIVEQLLAISKRSDGQLISTLQDIQAGRKTEIESLNLEIARIAASMQMEVPKTDYCWGR